MRDVLIKRNRKGRGLYATLDYVTGDIIEVSPMILFPNKQMRRGDKLPYYCFEWGEDHCALALGLGSLFNHSSRANVAFWHNKRAATTTFAAHRTIFAGEELLINYNGDPNDATPALFYPGDAK